MEERIIDDEYGRGIRLKKTKDGYMDVTDELAAEKEELEPEAADEVSFEFPMMDEDDEDLVGLSPEEALVLRQKKAEAAAQRQADYKAACDKGEALLAAENYTEAEKAFEKALELDEIATVASAGYWRAKTENFTKTDVLAEEYAKEGIESLQYDLGYEATDVLRRDYHEVFCKRVKELAAEETPLAAEVEEKQKNRRGVILARLYKSGIATVLALLATVAFAILAFTNFNDRRTVKDPTGFIVKACVFGALGVIGFIVLLIFVNKLYNALRIHLKNERLSSTEDGERLVVIRRYKALYEALSRLPEGETDNEVENNNSD